MTEKDLWATFEKTGSIADYLSYKGIHAEDGVPEQQKVGDMTFEPKNNSDRDGTVRDTYR